MFEVLGALGTGQRYTRLGAGQMGNSQAAQDERARQQALLGYDRAAGRVGQQALGQAMSSPMAGSNPFGAQRMAIDAGTEARAAIMSQRAQAEASMVAQQQAAAQARKEASEQRTRQMIGGIVGGAGQVLGTIMPAFAPVAGVAGGIGGAIGGQPMGGGGGGIGQLMGAITGQPAGGAPQAAQPQQAPVGAMALGNPMGETEEERRRRMGML